MALYETTVYGDFTTVVHLLKQDILASGTSMQLVDHSECTFGVVHTACMVFDKYYCRNSSRASLSVTVVSDGAQVYVSAIGAGAGQGIFINITFWAEDAILACVVQSVEKMAQGGITQAVDG